MNKNSNLQKALKQAFEEHKEPLNEAQWDRLSSALGEKKPKRKFFPWIFGVVVIVLLSAGLGYWIGNSNANKGVANGQLSVQIINEDKSLSSDNNNLSGTEQKPSTPKQENDQDNKSTQGKIDNNNNEQPQKNLKPAADNANNDKGKKILKNDIAGMQIPAKNSKGRDVKPGSENGSDTKKVNADISLNGNGQLPKDNDEKNKVAKDDVAKVDPNDKKNDRTADKKDEVKDATNDLSKDKIVATDPDKKGETKDVTNDKAKDKIVATDPNKKDEVKDVTSDKSKDKMAVADPDKKDDPTTPQKDKDSTKDKTKKNKDGDDVYKRFAIGFTSGISKAVYKNTTFTDPNKMHKDTKELYDESVSNTNSTFVNLLFEVKLYKQFNLTFNSGVQYRQVQNLEDITYKYNNILWRKPSGDVDFYIFKADSMHPEIIKNKSVHTTRFVAIPLSLAYTLPLGKKNELQLLGGVVLNKVISAKGSTFSINDIDVVNYKDKLDRNFSLGYLGGLNYYRQLYKPWWIGVGFQMQQSKTIFNTEYGSIKSNINITNYTFSIKYKF